MAEIAGCNLVILCAPARSAQLRIGWEVESFIEFAFIDVSPA